MNKATVLFASTTVLLAALSAYLARELHNERVLSDPVARIAPQQERTAEQQSVSMAVQQTPAATADSPPAQASSVAKDKSAQSAQPAYRNRLTHRTHREAQLAYTRLELERQLPDLAAALNLRQDEVGRLFDLLAKQQLGEAEVDKIPPREREKGAEARRQAKRSELVALLGEAKVAEWDQYVNSQGARSQIRELRTLLADSYYPLRGDQYEPLVASLAAEQKRHQAEREQLRSDQRDPDQPTHEEVIEYMGKRLDLIEASLQRRHRAAQSLLDSEQLRRYDSMLELERRRAQIDYDSFVTLNAEAAQAQSRAAQ